MNILVVGGAGYIGSCCSEYLLDHGHEVMVFDSLVKGHREAVDPRARFVQGDLADPESIDRALSVGSRVDGVIHFAAFIDVRESMVDPGRYFRNNVANGLNLVNAAVKHGIPKIVFSSTAATYGMPEAIPIPETCPTCPVNAYGDSKLMFERVLHWYREVHGLEYVALRYFNAAGATATRGEDHNPESHLIPIVLKTALGQRDSVKVFGTDYPTPDGTCIRDYVHVTDLAQAHLLALQKPVHGAFNLGSGSGYSVREIIDQAKRLTGCDFAVEEAPRRPGDPPRLVSDSTAARTVLGWRPTHDSVAEIIGSAWHWHSMHPTGYASR